MQAIILAAGMGKRLGELTRSNTKCMVEVNGRTLIDRLLSQLAIAGIEKVIIVVGYEGKKLMEHLGNEYDGLRIEYVDNPVYDKTNNIYSLYLAKDKLLEDDTVLIESDLIFEDSIFPKLINHPNPNLLVVAKYESWMDGTMVIIDQVTRDILNFIPGRAFDINDTGKYYKTVNIYKFSREFSSQYYVPFLEAYCKAVGQNEYYEEVLRVITMLDSCGLKALPLDGEKWYEIDDAQDLDIAETIFADKPDKLVKYHNRYGGYWRFDKLLDFCYLVNPFFPTDKLKKELIAKFETLLCEYPSGMSVNSLLMAKNFMLRPEYVVPGNGAAELIKSLIPALPGPIGMSLPSFEEYYNRTTDGNIRPVIPATDDFSYTADDVMKFFSESDIRSLLIINPDNPSGNFIPLKDLLRLCKWSAERNIRLVIDESFVDFSAGGDSNSLLTNGILESYPNLIVVKSISKSYGVPGLRLGLVASSDTELICHIKKDVPIWNINSFAEYYMQIYSKYERDYKNGCDLFRKERDRFIRELSKIPSLRVIPSQANYFLCELTGRLSSSELTKKLLEEHDILIKDCSKKYGFEGRNFIRIAVRDTTDNNRLVHALNNIEL